MNNIIDFRTPPTGFDDPLALWHACHLRVQRVIGLLERLREHVAGGEPDDSVQVTATTVRRYFNEAGPRHHEDEEVDLYPRLLARVAQRSGDAAAAPIARAIETLRSDHVSLALLWVTLDEALAKIEDGETAELDEATVALFVSGYRRHCEIEDVIIRPALYRELTADDLTAIGHSMAARRGLDWRRIAAPSR